MYFDWGPPEIFLGPLSLENSYGEGPQLKMFVKRKPWSCVQEICWKILPTFYGICVNLGPFSISCSKEAQDVFGQSQGRLI